MLVVTWTTVWNQQFFEGNFITARWGYFQHICIYLDCLVKNTGHSHNGVYGIPSYKVNYNLEQEEEIVVLMSYLTEVCAL